jgi:hypothetical protein
MASSIPRTYWMNFETGEQFRPPAAEPKRRMSLEPKEERIPFPYCYQRLILDDDEFQECKAEFIRQVNYQRFQHIFNARIAKK